MWFSLKGYSSCSCFFLFVFFSEKSAILWWHPAIEWMGNSVGNLMSKVTGTPSAIVTQSSLEFPVENSSPLWEWESDRVYWWWLWWCCSEKKTLHSACWLKISITTSQIYDVYCHVSFGSAMLACCLKWQALCQHSRGEPIVKTLSEKGL